MARRKLTTEVVKTVTIEFAYNVLTEGVPDDAAMTAAVRGGLHELGGQIISVKTTTRKVPVEEHQA